MNRNHRLKWFCLVLALGLLIASQASMAAAFPYVAYATDSVRLRGGPSASADILTVIRLGDAVLVTGTDGSYSIVEYEGRKGYVVSSFLGAPPVGLPDTAQPAQQPISGYVLLSTGQEGAAVKALQEALAELGYYRLSIDSKYGKGTSQAVEDFQDKNKLTKNGIADAAMQQLLFEGKPINSRGAAMEVKTLPPIPGFTIRPGRRGDAVAAIQQSLTTLKYYTGKIDGEYGSGTQDAVRAFQRANRLAADGIFGEKSFAALTKALAESLAPVATQAIATSQPVQTQQPSFVFEEQPLPAATYPYTTTAATSVNLRKRASTSAMRVMTIPQGATLEVVKDLGSFLQVNYRTRSGFVAKEFVNIPEQYLDGKVLPADQNARVNYETLAPGAQGRAVRALQHALSELGFYKGNVDGSFGPATTSGLKMFQKQNSLRETGIALPEVQQLIYEKRVRNAAGNQVTTKTLPPLDNITLQQGDFGDAILALHELLIASGHYDSNAGYEFTRATTLAVRAFQTAHKIKVTGKVDEFTMLALKTRVAALSPVSPAPQTPEPLTQDNITLIREGTTGLAVTRLQTRLVKLKYYSITPDGVFNADDVAALRHFQRVNSLPITGIADLATQQTLYTAYAIGADAQASQPQQGGIASGSSLSIGSRGDAVSALQSRLITLQYLSGRVDGIFGTQTAAAVTAFQRKNNIKQDGIAGSQTQAALYDAKAIGNLPVATQAPQTPIATPATSLKVGSSGPEVRDLQQRLIALKYLDGNADGIYGPRTFLAVKEFQQLNNLEADGIAGKLTLDRANLTSAVAKSPISPVVPVTPATPQPAKPSFTAPRASEVRYANWFTEIRPIAQRLRNIVIYDFMSGEHYNFRLFSLGKHADGTTLTAADTATMNKVLGVKNWTPRPVWVIFSDGRVYMASTHSHPHENDYIPGNDLTGHLCVHFPREMAEAEQTGPYAVSHQNAILAGWDLTQNMAR